MRQANDASFRTYTLHAENSVAVTTADVTLLQSMCRNEYIGFGDRVTRNSAQTCVLVHLLRENWSNVATASSDNQQLLKLSARRGIFFKIMRLVGHQA